MYVKRNYFRIFSERAAVCQLENILHCVNVLGFKVDRRHCPDVAQCNLNTVHDCFIKCTFDSYEAQ